jgi:hypothetical protein
LSSSAEMRIWILCAAFFIATLFRFRADKISQGALVGITFDDDSLY